MCNLGKLNLVAKEVTVDKEAPTIADRLHPTPLDTIARPSTPFYSGLVAALSLLAVLLGRIGPADPTTMAIAHCNLLLDVCNVRRRRTVGIEQSLAP